MVLLMKRALCIGLTVVLLVMLFIPLSLADGDSFINILLLGTDNFGYQQTGIGVDDEMSRADAIYVISLHPENKSIKLLSVERDYLAVLPNGLGDNKLGTSTFFGGPEMAMDVVNEMFDLDIQLYAHIDINKLISAIDIFGGVDVEILPEEIDGVNEFITGILIEDVPLLAPGINHLNGMQAWSLMGMRDHDMDAIESNSERNARQQRVLTAILKQASEKDLSTLLSLVNEVLPLVTTNISTAELIKLLEVALSMSFDHIDYQRTPAGSYKIKRVNMHRVVVPDNMEAEIDLIHQFFSN